MISTPTMFKLGFAQDYFNMGDATVSQADRDAILLKIDRAFTDAPKIDAFVSSKSKTDPNLDKTFGAAGASKFRDLLGTAGQLVGQVGVIQDGLKSSDPVDWTMNAVDQQHVTDYTAAISQLLAMVNAPQTAPGQPVAPAASGTILGMPPVVAYVGGGALALGILFAIFH